MSRKPRVVISAVRAPFASSTVFDPTVVACSTSVTGPGSRASRALDAVDDAFAVVVRRRCDLVGRDAAILGDGDEVGEGAADIDADPQAHAAGSQATAGNGLRVARSFARNVSVAARSISGGSPRAITP